ncbi:uncharacterized protein SPSK_06817 [Sporothrix schenckii 1099-18]|uniref:Uncharacterized protein n=1 Tax=Sporothrix schenckii 1099-18 TaxID=1397361 RepID=A0A0F2MJC1_SPOSC|nr:uncharacterized protein SPSK_06817 [Sporothrix schenckii 1099-18]KJR89159.1 hypothetical protein SPSK_06817 [Sporothrix schenckii 1099-18]
MATCDALALVSIVPKRKGFALLQNSTHMDTKQERRQESLTLCLQLFPMRNMLRSTGPKPAASVPYEGPWDT